jgi:mono/diheme cytochrome c family protein
MRKRLARILLRSVLVLTVIASLFVATVLVASRRKFDAPYPRIESSHDAAVVARGRYLVYGPAHCVNCHTPKSEDEAIKAGATPALIGGRVFSGPFGSVTTPNLTPDPETGIGRYTDDELARVLRHGVLPDGRALLPFMQTQNLSDEDLVAILSFLRSQKPVRNEAAGRDFNLVGKAILAFAIKPAGPTAPVLRHNPAPGTPESGEYLATAVASCASCHTKRNLLTGAFESPRFAGGMTFPLDEQRVIVTPNLTPAKAGRITSWSEEQFVGRVGAGVGIPGTHMPWRQFQSMTETDVRAIYRYLRTLDPVEQDPGPTLQSRKERKEKERSRNT